MIPWMLAFAGGSCSGKTTVRKAVANSFLASGIPALDIRFDNYYRDQSRLSPAEREAVNYDDPATVDLALLRRNLRKLRVGDVAEGPLYDMRTHTHEEGRSILYHPRPIVIVDGIFAFLLDNKQEDAGGDDGQPVFHRRIYFEADAEKCLERRIKKDIEDRGRTKKQAQKQWSETVYPGFLKYVEPQRSRADVVLTWNHPIEENQAWIQKLFTYLVAEYQTFRKTHPLD